MSRNILQTHKPYEELQQNSASNGKLILTDCMGLKLAFLFKNNRLLEVLPLDTSSKIGAIYIGKVKNVVKNLNACFVEIANGELCFLPFGEAKHPFIINRSFDGRILQGDELLVQVSRDAQKTKQAAVTCNITLQNDYFVFSVGNTKAGISTKLTKEQRSTIENILQKECLADEKCLLIQQENFPAYGCVIRTLTAELLEQDTTVFIDNFYKQQNAFLHLFEIARHRTCFSCIQAPKMPYEAILSYFSITDYEEVVTDLNEAYTSLQGYLANNNLRLYEDKELSLVKLYALENKLKDALSKTVWLKSGAYLVIEQTECLTTIDVNSGKMIQGSQNAEAVWRINEEAAREAALQIRLRNLSGIIIIDFINMKDKTAEESLIKYMKELTSVDKTITVVDITPLGLMELTRKKSRASLKEQLKQIE